MAYEWEGGREGGGEGGADTYTSDRTLPTTEFLLCYLECFQMFTEKLSKYYLYPEVLLHIYIPLSYFLAIYLLLSPFSLLHSTQPLPHPTGYFTQRISTPLWSPIIQLFLHNSVSSPVGDILMTYSHTSILSLPANSQNNSKGRATSQGQC